MSTDEAWSDLREGAIRKFCFVEIDLAGHSAIAANNSTRDAEATFGAFLDFIEEKSNTLGGQAWSLAGDGGLFAFYDDDVTSMAEHATAAALAIVDGLEEFNKTKSKVKQQVRARIAVHMGDARYFKQTGRIQSDDINFVAHLEKAGTKPDSVSISGNVFRELMAEEMRARFRDNGVFESRQVYTSAPDDGSPPLGSEKPPAQAQAPTGPVEIKDRYAVIIGIAEYQDPTIPKLKYATEDARSVHETLLRYGGFKPDNVKLLLNEQATYREIKSALGTFLPRSAQRDDAVFVYFAGHGCPDVDQSGDNPEDKVTKYLAPHDAHRDDLYSTAFPMDELSAMLKRVESQYVVVALDTCYSGQAGQGRTFETVSTRSAVLSNAFFDRVAGEGRVLITAADVNELSMELDTLGHGIFTHHLVEGLQGKGDTDGDGLVGIQELYEYLKERVAKDSMAAGGRQHPLLRGSLGGDMPLTNLKAKPAEPEILVDPVTRALDEAVRLQGLGQYGEALDCLSRALPSAGPRAPELRRAMGKTLLLKGEIEPALEAYRMALEADPLSAGGHAEYSAALLKAGDYAGAIEALRRAIRIDPAQRDHGVLIEMDLEGQVHDRPADWRLRSALAGVLTLQGNIDGATEQIVRISQFIADEEVQPFAQDFGENPTFSDLRANPKAAELEALFKERQEAFEGYKTCLEEGGQLQKSGKFGPARKRFAEGAAKWARYRESLEHKAAEAAALEAAQMRSNLERLSKESFLGEFIEQVISLRLKAKGTEQDPRAMERTLLEKMLASGGFLPLDLELAYKLFQTRCAARAEQVIGEHVERARRLVASDFLDRAKETVDTILAIEPSHAMGKALDQRIADIRKQQAEVGKALALVERLIRDQEFEKAAIFLQAQAKLLGGHRDYPQLLKVAEEGKAREANIQQFFVVASQKESQEKWLESFSILTQLRLAQPDDARVDKRYQEIRQKVGELERQQAGKAPEGMVFVPSGYFAMGEPGSMGKVRAPRLPVFLSGFFIDRTPVTIRQYMAFVEHIEKSGDHGKCHPDEPRKKSHRPRKWKDIKLDGDDLPVVGVDWFDAYAFSAWAGKRLLGEAEWEKAASWKEDEETKLNYPWGNDFDPTRCNCSESGIHRLTSVDRYAKAPSPYGVVDMCGNAYEWCAEWHYEYSFRRRLVTNPKGPNYGEMRILRGGAWDSDRRSVNTVHRSRAYSLSIFPTVGFRCAR